MINESIIVDTIENMVKNNDYLAEITLNGPGYIYYKERGERKSIKIPVITEEDYNQCIDYLIKKAGLIKNPYLVEGRYRFPGGKSGRLHIAMPPASPVPLVTLAIKTSTLTNLASLQGTGSFNTEISKFLKAAIDSKLTIVISGGTGAGKTTLLEALTSEFDIKERIGVCEDSPELMLDSPDTAYLNSTVWKPGLNKDDVAPLQWVVQQINRMRVDRIIIGETRGVEFFDFVTAANSGAEGSLTTIHANDGPAAMRKMSTFVYMAIDISPRIINEMISQAIDIVIQLGRSKKDGSHKILSIHEVTNAISAGDSPTIALNPLFEYEPDTNTWNKRFATDALKKRLQEYGYNPNSYSIENKGNDVDLSPRGLPSYFNKGD